MLRNDNGCTPRNAKVKLTATGPANSIGNLLSRQSLSKTLDSGSVAMPSDPLYATKPGLVLPGDGLHPDPAEGLFDAFADTLAQSVAGVARGAPVNGGALAAIVLGERAGARSWRAIC